jgi:hypothetical protein
MADPVQPVVPPPAEPQIDPGLDMPLHFSPWMFLYEPLLLLYQPLYLLGGAFWLWMVIHCVRNDLERGMWLWILFLFNLPGAVIYFFVRWLPGARIGSGASFLNRWTKRRQLPRLEAAARNIGNCHQFVELGDALRETGKHDRAAECYSKALQKDATHLPALWGAAQVAMHRQNLAEARGHLETILAKDSSYKFGDVSLAHCRALCGLKDAAAREKLEQHLKRWPHPEPYVLLATLLIEQGDHETARAHLETTLLDLRGGPAFFARQNRAWARKARRLLGRLPRLDPA